MLAEDLFWREKFVKVPLTSPTLVHLSLTSGPASRTRRQSCAVGNLALSEKRNVRFPFSFSNYPFLQTLNSFSSTLHKSTKASANDLLSVPHNWQFEMGAGVVVAAPRSSYCTAELLQNCDLPPPAKFFSPLKLERP